VGGRHRSPPARPAAAAALLEDAADDPLSLSLSQAAALRVDDPKRTVSVNIKQAKPATLFTSAYVPNLSAIQRYFSLVIKIAARSSTIAAETTDRCCKLKGDYCSVYVGAGVANQTEQLLLQARQ
jgi:hypothetical protein